MVPLILISYFFSWSFCQSYSFQFYPSNQVHDFLLFNNNKNNNSNGSNSNNNNSSFNNDRYNNSNFNNDNSNSNDINY